MEGGSLCEVLLHSHFISKMARQTKYCIKNYSFNGGHELVVRIIAMVIKQGLSPSPRRHRLLVQDQQLRTGSIAVKKLGVIPHQALALASCWWKRINIVINTPLHGMRM